MYVLGDLFSRISAQRGVLFPEEQVLIIMFIIMMLLLLVLNFYQCSIANYASTPVVMADLSAHLSHSVFCQNKARIMIIYQYRAS